MLKLHESEKDYVVLFDYHDDVAVLDSAMNPTQIEFYQIKTKKVDNWTLRLLVTRDKGKDQSLLSSIVGRMYANKLKFEKTTKCLTFVSNARFRVKLKNDPEKDGVVDTVEWREFCAEAIRELSKAIQEEHDLPYCPLCDVLIRFRTDALSLEEHVEHSQGLLVRYLSGKHPEGKFAISAAHKAIATTVARKWNYEREILTIDDLVKNKGICRDEFESMLKTIVSEVEEKERWHEVSQVLLTEKVLYGELTRIHNSWKKYDIQRMDASNTLLMGTQSVVREAIRTTRSEGKGEHLVSLLDECLLKVKRRYSGQPPFDDVYLKAVILFESFHEE